MYWPAPTPPTSKWMVRNGDVLQIANYPELFSVLGNRYGGNGSTTFALPSDRGKFIRGWNNSSADQDAGRVLGSIQGDAIRNITGGLYSYFDKHPVHESGVESTGAFYLTRTSGRNQSDSDTNPNVVFGMYFDASRVVPTAADNHPYNIAYLPIIKVK